MEKIIKEKETKPTLGMKVYHEEIYNGNEPMIVIGIRKTEVELEGDYSGGTNAVTQKSWIPIDGLFRKRKMCDQYVRFGTCTLHNLHCGYPDCQPYL